MNWRVIFGVLTLLTPVQVVLAEDLGRAEPSLFEARRPTHTYSIVALDAATGQLGAAVQTHAFAVGTRVIWAQPGVGAVATQSFTDPSYGPLGLELMSSGKSAGQALAGLLAADPNTQGRQVGMVDAGGMAANFTGKKAITEHCRLTGDGYAVQANLMEKPTVCSAMSQAFEQTRGDLASRLMAALTAAQGEGGDIRGKQSAALLLVAGDKGTPQWEAEKINLRVDDHSQPLLELARLLTIRRASLKDKEGDRLLAEGHIDDALAVYAEVENMVPESHETVFWHAVSLASVGREADSLVRFKKAFDAWPLWREVVQRLPASDLLPDDDKMLRRILAVN